MSHNLSRLVCGWNRGLILLFLVLSSQTVSAQQLLIEGSAPAYPGRKISAFTVDDYLSGALTLWATAEISAAGSFKLEGQINHTREIELYIGSVKAILHARPGASYSIVFPAPGQDQARTFDETEVELVLENEDPGELNTLIRAFNQDYTLFIRDHFYDFAREQYQGSEVFRAGLKKRGEQTDMFVESDTTKVSAPSSPAGVAFNALVSSFSKTMDDRYSPHYDDQYFKDYVHYSVAELELVSGRQRTDLYRDHFMSRKIQPDHPSYMHFFDLFYSGLLTDQHGTKKAEIVKCINAEKNGIRLLQVFQEDSLCQSSAVRSLAIIKGLRDSYDRPEFISGAIVKILRQLSLEIPDTELQQIAGRVLDGLLRGKAGSPLGEFTLLDPDNNRWSWPDNAGSYTYFLFFAEWCTPCKKDLLIMETLRKAYGKDIRFVAVCMDDDYKSFLNYTRDHRDQQMEFLYAGTDPLIRKRLNIRAIPHAIFVNPEGLLTSDYTRRPGEGIQMEFSKIAEKSRDQGSGTWRHKQ